MDHVFNGTFYADRKGIEWVPEGEQFLPSLPPILPAFSILTFLFLVSAAGDGVFSLQEDNLIKLVDLKTNKTTTLLDVSDIRDSNGRQMWMVDWKLSPDMKRVLVKTDYKKVRCAFFNRYFCFSRGLIVPLSSLTN
jgi:dipeptidyl aminopeptidase B